MFHRHATIYYAVLFILYFDDITLHAVVLGIARTNCTLSIESSNEVE